MKIQQFFFSNVRRNTHTEPRGKTERVDNEAVVNLSGHGQLWGAHATPQEPRRRPISQTYVA